jgi:hypothetical protein
MISVHFRKILALVITLALATVTTVPAYAQATTFTERVIEPLDASVIACNGEEVTLTGELHLTFQTTIDARGGIHERFTLVPHKIRGVGSVTGTQYSLVGGHRSHFNADADSAPLIFMNTEMFNLVSQGGTDNLQAKINFHVTVNANGVETVLVDSLSVRCVG